MVCIPCIALPAALLGGGTSLMAHSDTVFIISLVLTLVFIIVYIYFKYYKNCPTCIY